MIIGLCPLCIKRQENKAVFQKTLNSEFSYFLLENNHWNGTQEQTLDFGK